jgi:hypothetical protein
MTETSDTVNFPLSAAVKNAERLEDWICRIFQVERANAGTYLGGPVRKSYTQSLDTKLNLDGVQITAMSNVT